MAHLRQKLLEAEVSVRDPRSPEFLNRLLASDSTDATARTEADATAPRKFIPDRALEVVLTEETISRVLSGRQLGQDFYKLPELIQLIVNGGRKLLGILILIRREDAIIKFLIIDRLQSLDSMLPVSLDTLNKILGNHEDAIKFLNVQFKFLVPVLQKDRSHRVFESNETILPFIECRHLASGGFGSIAELTCYPSHQRLVDLNLDGAVSESHI